MDLDAIFKSYDIRGVYPSELSEDLARKVGQAFAEYVDSDTVMIGHDMRESAETLVNALIDGVTSQGVHVKNAGMMSTDMSYFAAGKYNLPTLMVTASHNPPEYNGIKFTNAGAIPIGQGSGLEIIRQRVEAGDFTAADTSGQVEETDIMDDYVAHVMGMIDTAAIKPLKIAVDAANCMGGFITPPIFGKLPCEIVPLYFDLDGSMPNHEANPIDPANVQDLIAKVKAENCDLGIAFDGDADRAYFIDEQGGRISASLIGALVAKSMLAKHPGATIIYNAVSSRIVPEVIEENGGTAVMERVGHSYIKKTMRETNAVYATEHSGHYYFAENYFADSGMLAALMLVEMISKADQPLSELLKEFQRYSAIEETNSDVADKPAKLEELKKIYSDAEIEEFDGVTFTYPDYWFNVRPSGTEPKMRLNLEAKTPELRDEKAAEVLKAIRG